MYTEKSTSIRDDINKTDQTSFLRASLTSLSTSPSTTVACKLCLNDVTVDNMTKIQQCGCLFCIDVRKNFVVCVGLIIFVRLCDANLMNCLFFFELKSASFFHPIFKYLHCVLFQCMKAYVEFEILEGAYDISCPDALCPHQGIMDIEDDIAALATSDLVEKHRRYRLNRGKYSFHHFPHTHTLTYADRIHFPYAHPEQ